MEIHNWKDCWFDKSRDYGHVVLTKLKDGKVKYKYNYRLVNSGKLVRHAHSSKDTYISLNAFKNGVRREDHLQQLRNVGVDLDFYKLEKYRDMAPWEALDVALAEVNRLIVEEKIPEPNLVCYSHGIQLIWSIEGGLPASMSWATRYITQNLINRLKELGADSKCVDPTRLFRVPTSFNSRNGAPVQCEVRRKKLYKYSELAKYATQEMEVLKGTKAKGTKLKNNKQVKTNAHRVKDLITLAKKRGKGMEGYRNVWLFWYSFSWLLCHDVDFDTFQATTEVTQHKYVPGLTVAEVQSTLISAWDDSNNFKDYYASNGYKITFVANDGIVKPAKTASLLKAFEITMDEQDDMKTLISPAMASQRHKKQARDRWRSKGAVPRAEYNAKIQRKKQEQIKIVKGFLSELPTATKKHIAWLVGFSRKTLYQTIKILTIDNNINVEKASVAELLLYLKKVKEHHMLSALEDQSITDVSGYNDYDTATELILSVILQTLHIDVGKQKDRSSGLVET